MRVERPHHPTSSKSGVCGFLIRLLSLPNTKFERTDGAIRQGSDTQQCLQIARSDVCRARPSGAKREAAPHCTIRFANAHGTEFRELLYPWHPWSGLRIGINGAIERPGGVVFRCGLTASDANRWLEIPAWMFDRSACAKVRVAVEPHIDLPALVMLGALLRDARIKRSTASDAANSGVSPHP